MKAWWCWLFLGNREEIYELTFFAYLSECGELAPSLK